MLRHAARRYKRTRAGSCVAQSEAASLTFNGRRKVMVASRKSRQQSSSSTGELFEGTKGL